MTSHEIEHALSKADADYDAALLQWRTARKDAA